MLTFGELGRSGVARWNPLTNRPVRSVRFQSSKIMDIPEIGTPAPDFEGTMQDGTTVSLSQFRGRRLALYFYPRDNTSGCTKQACNLRDHFSRLGDEGIAIVGVSDDPVESHEAFASEYDLPFPLLADTGHDVVEAYGVWGEKNMYGRKYMGTKRTTFLIDGDGIIRDVIRRPRTGDHADEIIRRFGEVDGRPE